MQYRADIDGLRAVAVVSVVAFHAFPKLLPSGFVGVDVFFVISGYLITKLIVGEMAAGTFTFSGFYLRRARRLLPALALVLPATLAIGWMVLLPAEFAKLGKHVVAGTFFSSNLLLWAEDGYFDDASNSKPLLHLWSLAVEEQFYAAWPALLLLATRSRIAMQVCIAITAVSLFAALWWVRSHEAMVFFSPMTRIWEPLVGAVVALHARPIKRPVLVSSIGFALIAMAMSGISGIPSGGSIGPDNLMAVAGAAALVAGSAPILTARPLVWLGKISYPLYLWHWPPLAVRNLLGVEDATAFTLVAVAGAVLLAELTYRFVEKPVRFGTRPPLGLSAVAIGLLAAVTTAFAATSEDVTRRRIAAGNRLYATAVRGAGIELAERACLGTNFVPNSPFCWSDARLPIHYAVWGDSKGEALFWGLLREGHARGMGWALIGHAGCMPSTRQSASEVCNRVNEAALQRLAASSVHTVLLVFGERSFDFTASDKASAGLKDVVRRLVQAGKSVGVVLDTPTVVKEKGSPTACRRAAALPFASLLAGEERCSLALTEHQRLTRAYREAVAQAIAPASDQVMIYDPTPILCDQTHCPVAIDNSYLYSYGDHVSDTASTMIAKDLLPRIARVGP